MDIQFDNSHVYLDDERSISVPLWWYPRLYFGALENRDNWKLFCNECKDVYDSIEWDTLDEHIRLDNLLEEQASYENPASIRRWLHGKRLYEVCDE